MAEPLNAVQQLLQAKFNIDAQAAVSVAWDGLAKGTNPDQVIATFGKTIADLRARRDKLDQVVKT